MKYLLRLHPDFFGLDNERRDELLNLNQQNWKEKLEGCPSS